MIGREPWMDEALCAETDPDMFFPEKGDEGRAAKRICGECPVRSACLEYALTNNLQLGIWGGLAIAERRKLAAAARRSAA